MQNDADAQIQSSSISGLYIQEQDIKITNELIQDKSIEHKIWTTFGIKLKFLVKGSYYREAVFFLLMLSRIRML